MGLGRVLGDEGREIPFGKYVLVRKIAVGGMAEVYLAKSFGQFGFEKPVVVKVLLPKLAADEEFREMFVREALMAADFRHPRLCQVYDVGEANGLYYIAMEFVDGVDLTRLVRRARAVGEPLPRSVAVRLALDLVDGLKYVHSAKASDGSPLSIVHRDVTPQNIMVAFDGQVKLVDFGVAKTTLAEELKANALKGKGPYMAPEQWQGGAVDGRADLFALAIVLYELTLGKRLFKRGNPAQVRKAIICGEVTPPREVRPDYPEALEVVVMRALSLDPADRYQTAAELGGALATVARSQGLFASREQVSAYIGRLFASVSRDEVFRPLELTAPGHAVEAVGRAKSLDCTGTEVSSPEPAAARASNPWLRALAMGMGAAVLVLAGVLLGMTGWFGSLPPSPRAGARASTTGSGLALRVLHRAPSPPSLRGCRATFHQVTVNPKGRVESVGRMVQLTCPGGASMDASRIEQARQALRSWRFAPVTVAGEPVGTTTPMTVTFANP